MDENQTSTIRKFNDQFRKTLEGGRVIITSGVDHLGADRLAQLLIKVRAFDDFGPDNDPHSEHDFGAFEDEGIRFFWKIDYYDPSYEYGSENPADPTQTVRVLTLLLADEY